MKNLFDPKPSGGTHSQKGGIIVQERSQARLPQHQQMHSEESGEHQVPRSADLAGPEMRQQHLRDREMGPAETELPEEAEV